MEKYERWQKDIVLKALKTRRIVLLNGPRQCGKTTLVRELASPDIKYANLDDLITREKALVDPIAFVKHDGRTLIIDEIQRAPELIIAMKKEVDEDTRPGQYLLTGSANIWAMPTVQESLAGRIRKVRLRPLSQGEIRGAQPTFLTHAFDQDFNYKFRPEDKKALLALAAKGGFPEVLPLEGAERRQWYIDYVSALLERDLKEVALIHNHNAMSRLVEILAAWSSKYMDVTAISSGLSVKWETMNSYINVLEAMYLVDRIQAWYTTDYDRVAKKPKIFMADSGLMFSMLSWSLEQVTYQSDAVGKLIETFAYNELAAQAEAHAGAYKLFHYRDREKREIDFVIEREGGALLGVEVKAASVVRGTDFKHLNWFKEHIAKGKPFVGVVLYTGEHALRFGENMWAVPFGMLWPEE